jgi:hypothetical protein
VEEGYARILPIVGAVNHTMAIGAIGELHGYACGNGYNTHIGVKLRFHKMSLSVMERLC